MKAEGARFAFVEDATTLADQVQPVGPAGVSRFNAIVEAIYQRGKLDAQLAHARAGNIGALNFILWTAEEDVIAHVRLHLPHISGMRFKNVDSVEVDLAAILLSELIQGGNLPPKWRSGVASEYQHDRFRRPQRCQLYGCLCLQCLNAEVRSRVAHV